MRAWRANITLTPTSTSFSAAMPRDGRFEASCNDNGASPIKSEPMSPISEQPSLGLTWNDLRVSAEPSARVAKFLRGTSSRDRDAAPILKGLEGVLESGQMLLVLGKPGSGCSTFLKVIAGHTDGLQIDSTSQLTYRGSQNLAVL